MVEPLDVIITGIFVVFLMLTLLTVMMYLTGMFFSREIKEEEKEIAAEGLNNAEKDIPGGDLISSEEIATITAALCAYLGRPVMVGIPQPLLVSPVNRTWSFAGKIEQMAGMGGVR